MAVDQFILMRSAFQVVCNAVSGIAGKQLHGFMVCKRAKCAD